MNGGVQSIRYFKNKLIVENKNPHPHLFLDALLSCFLIVMDDNFFF